MPIFSAIAAGIGSILGGLGTFLAGGTTLAGITKLGLGLAAQFALGALFPQQGASRAVKSEVQYGTDLAREVVLGTVGTAGHHIYRNANEKGNRTVRDVVVVSNFRVQGVERIRRNGKWVTLGGTSGDGYRITDLDYLRMRIYLGTLAQAADADLISSSNPAGRWTSAHRGAGQAYVHVRNKLNQENHPSPWEPFFEVVGPKLYDWRKDSTVGGSGADRWNDQDTWSGRHDNPILQMYALERGIWQNGELIVGKGVSVSRLPLDRWTLAANICDEAVEGKPRYSASIIAKAGPGITHASNMEPLLNACAASWIDGPDGEYPMVGVNQAVAASITDADLMPDEPYRFSLYRPRTELVNTVAGTYCNPENFYASDPLAVRNLALAVTQDGERLATSITYDAVTDPAQCDRLTDIQLRANRYQANGEICVHPKFIGVKVGQWVRWNSATRGDRKFQVLKRRLGPVGDTSYRNVYWTIQEVSDGIFDPTAFVTNPPIPVIQGEPDYQTELDEFQLNPVIVVNPDGIERAGFKALWLELEDLSVKTVEFRYWPTNQPDVVTYHTVSADALSTLIMNAVVQRTQYAFQYRLHADPPRPTVWTAVITRVAPEVTTEFYPIDLGEAIANLNENLRWLADGVRNTKDELQAAISNATAGQFHQYDHTVREVKAASDRLTSSYREEIIAAVGPNSALVMRVEELEARVGDSGTIVTAIDSLTARITTAEDGITANASAITAVQTSLNGVTANSTFRMEAGYTPGAGYTARIGMEARVDTGSTWRAAGLYADVNASQARLVLTADQVAIFAGGVLSALFDAGTAYIANARIRNLDAGNITASKIDAALILQNGTTLTDLIADWAVTNTVAVQGITSIPASGTANIAAATITIARSTSKVIIRALITIKRSSTLGGEGPVLRLKRGTTVLILASDSFRERVGQSVVFEWVESVSPGTYTYALEYTGNTAVVDLHNSSITVTELKK